MPLAYNRTVFRRITPVAGYFFSPLLVLVTSWLLGAVQHWMISIEGVYVQPYSVGFMLPIAIITLMAGRNPGYFTVALCALATSWQIRNNRLDFISWHPADLVELFFLVAVGVLLVTGLSALHEVDEERARLNAVMDTAPVGVLLCDPDGKLTYANSEAERIWGQQFESVGPENYSRYGMKTPAGEDNFTEDTGLTRALTGEHGTITREVMIERPDRSMVWVESRSMAIRDDIGKIMQGLTVFSDISGRKQVEQDLKNRADRERRVASMLQESVLPQIPSNLPGVEVHKYYEAALSEAQVGGDFYDVFPIEKNCYAVVVGDVSGKGLSAAQQVATVRNMLRFALFEGRSIALAMTRLNSAICAHELLPGFVTIFVGAIDTGLKTLTYVSAGHEPGLIVRASNAEVEQLGTTGPPLGVMDGMNYDEKIVNLVEKDTLVLYTDGLSDAGPQRSKPVGVDGIKEILHQEAISAPNGAELILSLTNRIKGLATKGFSDDVCILTATVSSQNHVINGMNVAQS